MISRLRSLWLPASVMALAVAPSTASGFAHVHSLSALSGRAKVAGLALREAQLVQTGAGLQFTVRLDTHGEMIPAQSTVCITLQAPGTIDWCFVRRAHAWHSTVGGRPSGTVTALGRGQFVSQRPLEALGAKPGAVRWSVTSHVPACIDTSDQPCDDHLPAANRAPKAARLWTPVASGCTSSAGKLVTTGPPTKRIAITFDDGPSTYTSQVQSILRKQGINATFFLIGRQVPAEAAVLRQALAAGDELANHSWDHPSHALSGGELTSEITQTQSAIQGATGFTPCLFRPPGGMLAGDTVGGAGALGLATVTWSVDPRDWATPGTDAIISGILGHTAPGAIILDHDGGGDRSETVAALPTVIQTLKARGFQFVTVSELLGNTTTYGLRPN